MMQVSFFYSFFWKLKIAKTKDEEIRRANSFKRCNTFSHLDSDNLFTDSDSLIENKLNSAQILLQFSNESSDSRIEKETTITSIEKTNHLSMSVNTDQSNQ